MSKSSETTKKFLEKALPSNASSVLLSPGINRIGAATNLTTFDKVPLLRRSYFETVHEQVSKYTSLASIPGESYKLNRKHTYVCFLKFVQNYYTKLEPILKSNDCNARSA